MGNPLIGASGIISTVRLITAFEMSEGSFMYRKTAPADNPADIRKLRIARVSINFLKVLFLLAVRRMRIELDQIIDIRNQPGRRPTVFPVVWAHTADHHYPVKGPTVVGPCPHFSEQVELGTSFDANGQLVARDEGDLTVDGTAADTSLARDFDLAFARIRNQKGWTCLHISTIVKLITDVAFNDCRTETAFRTEAGVELRVHEHFACHACTTKGEESSDCTESRLDHFGKEKPS